MTIMLSIGLKLEYYAKAYDSQANIVMPQLRTKYCLTSLFDNGQIRG